MDRSPVTLSPLTNADREAFILENQRAFRFGAMQECGETDPHFEDDGEIISRSTIENAIDSGEAFLIMRGGEKLGGAVLRVNGDHGELLLLFVSPEKHSQGIGFEAWCAVEKLHPEVTVWETETPYFEKRNIHFYVNRCGFHIVEFYHRYHPDPHFPDGDPDDEMFRFVKTLSPKGS